MVKIFEIWRNSRLRFSLLVGLFTLLMVGFVRWRMGAGFLLLDRIFEGGGLIQIAVVVVFSIYASYMMWDPKVRPRWRRGLWLGFSVWFFVQLFLGLVLDSLFLMSGKLHFPIPSVILTGALNRFELGFMPILFVVTVVLTGGAWCSQLCYFGAFDSLADTAGGQMTKKRGGGGKRQLSRFVFLMLFIVVALGLRWFGASTWTATLVAGASGVLGLLAVVLSYRRGTMVHCSYFCPLGVVVSVFKYLSPFRFSIDTQRCTRCMACVAVCRHGALTKEAIVKGSPTIGCTYCGDCQAVCSHNAPRYRLWRFSPENSQKIFLATVLVLYFTFFCVARV